MSTGWLIFLIIVLALLFVIVTMMQIAMRRASQTPVRRVPRSALTLPKSHAFAPSAPAEAAAPPPADKLTPEIQALRRMGARQPRPAVPKPAPRTYIYRWFIEYTDAEGNESTRFIEFDTLQDRNHMVTAWCTKRNEERTFYLGRCSVIEDCRTGEVVVGPGVDNLDAWLTQYRRDRRRR